MTLSFRLRRAALLLATLLVIGGAALPYQHADAQDVSFDLERVQRATVLVMQARSTGSSLAITCVGSGTIVSRDGLILTNAHNTVTGTNCPGDTLIIALSVRLGEAPIPRYQAEIVQADAGIDLALLRITRQNDGRLIAAGSLALPFVELADSSQLQLDSTITVVGYPGIGDDPIGAVRGTINGFAAEPSGGEKSWIKSSTEIPAIMSGGGAYDQEGRLIGVPTTAPISGFSPEATCITLQDTNNDGLINRSDICIPIGSTLNSLRPSNFARPLLRAASLGLSVEAVTSFPALPIESGTPTFRRLFFSPSVNEAGMPTTVIRSLPAGINSLYLFFDYANMTPETVYELRVTIDGIPNPTFSLSPVRWSGGRRGLWYVGSSDQPWPNGLYDFTLFIDGIAADSARLLIGTPATDDPVMSDIVFGIADVRGNVLGNGFVLPTGNTASARFLYRNMIDGAPWTAIWYYEGVEVFRTPEGTVWTDGPNGAKTIPIQDPNGLLPGNYRLELYVEDRLSATSDFTLAGAQEGASALIFADPHYTTAATPQEAVTAASISTFSAGTESIYALFDWQQIAPGTLWTMRWLVDGEVFFQQTQPWNGTQTGNDYLMRLFGQGGVPDGTYRLDLLVNRVQFVSIQSRVGIGQLPIDRFALATGAQMRGQILDFDTGLGIPGVTFVLISEDYSIADFTRDWNQEQVYAIATTDRNGRFEIDRPLQFNVPYSVLITAEGYLPIAADGIEIASEDNPIDMQIYLSKD